MNDDPLHPHVSSSPWMTSERLQRGYVIVLPGIEGYSWLNRRIRKGLLQAEVPYAIEIFDWTRHWILAFYSLRSRKWHARQSQRIQEKILAYQARYPNRPVFLIGHSGGGAMALQTLAELPEKTQICGAILLGAAMSPAYQVQAALRHVERKVWNFTSFADCLFLGLMTGVVGTFDGRHSVCSGMVGFRKLKLSPFEAALIEERPYQWSYLSTGNCAGHFGFTSPRFIAKYVAPLVLQQDERNPGPCLSESGAYPALP